MDFPSSGARHALRVDEHDTTKFLAHARQQADQRRFSDFLIVDVDSHIDESLSFSSIIGMMDSDVMRHFARSATRGALAHNLEYEDAAGRMPRFAAAKLEKTSENVLRDVVVTNRRMDAMGVDFSCVLPTALLRLSVQPRRDIELEVAGGYNRWLVETFLPQAPRLRGMLYLPLCDAEACVRTIADFGGKGGVVGAVVAAESYASIHRNPFMRTYSAMEERGLVLGFHSGVNWYDRALGQSNRYLAVKSVGGPHFNAVHLANWIVNGLPERFPKLKVLWMESGISWLLPLMARLDAGYLARSYDAPLLKRRPSEYMREMFYRTQPLERFADRDLLAAMFREINAETQLVWGSNYPNSDFDLPSAVYDLPFLTEDGKRRILGENAKLLFACRDGEICVGIPSSFRWRRRVEEVEMANDMTVDMFSTGISSDDDRASLESSTGFARTSLGLIIPAGNRMIERQFGYFAPRELGIHAARLQMNGKYHKPFPQLLEGIAAAARTLADARVDLIGFHCTATAMEYGPEGEQRICDVIREATNIPAVSTGQAVIESLSLLDLRKLVLITPYLQSSNDYERRYLAALGIEVVHDVALGELGTREPSYMISPARWIEITRANARDEADGYFLSCSNTTQIDTISPLERELLKPVVASNQAMLWTCLERLGAKLGPRRSIAAFGRLVEVN